MSSRVYRPTIEKFIVTHDLNNNYVSAWICTAEK